MTEDESHLNALAIAHYVVGGLGVLFACFPLIHVIFGVSILSGVGEMSATLNGKPVESAPQFVGWVFFAVGFVFFLIGQSVSILLILSGRFLQRRRNYNFSFVLACIACIAFPVGTVLGIFTIIVLSRSPVKTMYGV